MKNDHLLSIAAVAALSVPLSRIDFSSFSVKKECHAVLDIAHHLHRELDQFLAHLSVPCGSLDVAASGYTLFVSTNQPMLVKELLHKRTEYNGFVWKDNGELIFIEKYGRQLVIRKTNEGFEIDDMDRSLFVTSESYQYMMRSLGNNPSRGIETFPVVQETHTE